MRIPSNKIILNQTTSGGQYMTKNTQTEYIGDYYIIGEQYFAGTQFSTKSLELVPIKSTQINPLLAQSSTIVYGQQNTHSSLNNLLKTFKISDSRFLPTSDDVNQGFVTRYFCQQLNVSPILIKEINQETYSQLINNSLYNVISLNYYFTTHDTTMGNFLDEDLSKANTKIPGLITYLESQGKNS